MADAQALAGILRRIDGRGYKAYRELGGAFELDGLKLFVDHVQGDPFAAPSKMRIRVPMERAGLDETLRRTRVQRVALADFLARQCRAAIGRLPRLGGPRGSGRSHVLRIDAGGQEVLERSAVVVTDAFVEARLHVGLPADGRRVLGRRAEVILLEQLPQIAREALCAESHSPEEVHGFVECIENQEAIRARLPELGLVAFVANGSVLPRESGASDRPLASGAVAFESPESLEVTLPLEHPVAGSREIRGMGIPEGVTLIVGGGYHGKSTLLRALERGVYPHVPGDGREWVVSRPDLVKVRAEDGRRVERVDISGFIDRLPGGRETRSFRSDDASGSTSQAANIAEAIEAGARGILLDEDTSATNFMVRDARMQALVHREHEPITPFVDRIRELYEAFGVSTVLVMGGCGDYFDVADRVLALREFVPRDATEEAGQVATSHPSTRSREAPSPLARSAARVPESQSFDASRGRRDVKVQARGTHELVYGSQEIDLRGLEQLIDPSQTRAIGFALVRAARDWMRDGAPLHRVLDAVEHELDERGVDGLEPFGRGGHPGDLARPRRFEVAGAINRLRSLRMAPPNDA
ncbi:MAG: ABC-ATPase domain-containing protein [Proteobacteria bacterium]|nr:ABC-ATPase domain-containing protein [Pseudomonadota bacterium]